MGFFLVFLFCLLVFYLLDFKVLCHLQMKSFIIKIEKNSFHLIGLEGLSVVFPLIKNIYKSHPSSVNNYDLDYHFWSASSVNEKFLVAQHL